MMRITCHQHDKLLDPSVHTNASTTYFVPQQQYFKLTRELRHIHYCCTCVVHDHATKAITSPETRFCATYTYLPCASHLPSGFQPQLRIEPLTDEVPNFDSQHTCKYNSIPLNGTPDFFPCSCLFERQAVA